MAVTNDHPHGIDIAALLGYCMKSVVSFACGYHENFAVLSRTVKQKLSASRSTCLCSFNAFR